MRTDTLAATPAVQYVLLAVAVLLHLAVGPFYLASGLLAPGWAVLLLWLTWVAGAGAARAAVAAPAARTDQRRTPYADPARRAAGRRR